MSERWEKKRCCGIRPSTAMLSEAVLCQRMAVRWTVLFRRFGNRDTYGTNVQFTHSPHGDGANGFSGGTDGPPYQTSACSIKKQDKRLGWCYRVFADPSKHALKKDGHTAHTLWPKEGSQVTSRTSSCNSCETAKANTQQNSSTYPEKHLEGAPNTRTASH